MKRSTTWSTDFSRVGHTGITCVSNSAGAQLVADLRRPALPEQLQHDKREQYLHEYNMLSSDSQHSYSLVLIAHTSSAASKYRRYSLSQFQLNICFIPYSKQKDIFFDVAVVEVVWIVVKRVLMPQTGVFKGLRFYHWLKGNLHLQALDWDHGGFGVSVCLGNTAFYSDGTVLWPRLSNPSRQFKHAYLPACKGLRTHNPVGENVEVLQANALIQTRDICYQNISQQSTLFIYFFQILSEGLI